MSERGPNILLSITLALGVSSVVICALFCDHDLTLGVAAGAGVGTLNLYFWVLVIRRLLGISDSGRTGIAVRLLLKYGLTGGLIAALLLLANINLTGFAIGISNLVLGPIIGGLMESRRLPHDSDTPESGQTPR
jgi:hypothetical protein